MPIPSPTSLNIIFDLCTRKFTVCGGSDLTYPVDFTLTNPVGTSIGGTHTIASQGACIDILFSSQLTAFESSGILIRGDWTFSYVPSSGSSGQVIVPFTSTNFPITTQGQAANHSLAVAVDCFSSIVSSTDNTDYTIDGEIASLITYENTISPPPSGISGSTISNSQLASVSSEATPVFTGSYTGLVTGEAAWEWTKIDTLSNDYQWILKSCFGFGSQRDVDCVSGSLCDVWECLKNINDLYMAELCVNERSAKKYKLKLERALQLAYLAELAMICGDSATTYLDEIKTVTGCTSCS